MKIKYVIWFLITGEWEYDTDLKMYNIEVVQKV